MVTPESEYNNNHYSDKGGHKRRSSFWRNKQENHGNHREGRWVNRRKMRRTPNDGKKQSPQG